MWPFKEKKPERDFTNETIADLKNFRDIGETFNYLGRNCILHSMIARANELPALINQNPPM